MHKKPTNNLYIMRTKLSGFRKTVNRPEKDGKKAFFARNLKRLSFEYFFTFLE